MCLLLGGEASTGLPQDCSRSFSTGDVIGMMHFHLGVEVCPYKVISKAKGSK